ncbi:MAG TPA: ChaN family lipoprotein [Ramlibacter sp.]|uniref:ChaN family lipoprotein n=1 Tax=Ramlibacter sp. TaxID=1917967 RepID=UPI002CF135F0|nr:ChaN family lipoprotein [Ramlibacter sp.]HVZ42668.1 ChaN family lipoprotein [Ramlibacter sp.]
MRGPMRHHVLFAVAALLVAALFVAGCAASAGALGEDAAEGAREDVIVPALLVGEQHDAPEHQRLHRDLVDVLAARGELAAVVLEMAGHGRSTAGLAAEASEESVRQALGWSREAGWSWELYGPAVMAAVRAGVPVVGGNIGATEMRAARADEALDSLVPPAALRSLRESIRSGHCDMLPAAQLAPMARIQIARDRAMAEAVTAALRPGKTVVLIAGSGHVDPLMGVPLHLPVRLRARSVQLPPVDTSTDYCAQLRERPRSAG